MQEVTLGEGKFTSQTLVREQVWETPMPSLHSRWWVLRFPVRTFRWDRKALGSLGGGACASVRRALVTGKVG